MGRAATVPAHQRIELTGAGLAGPLLLARMRAG